MYIGLVQLFDEEKYFTVGNRKTFPLHHIDFIAKEMANKLARIFKEIGDVTFHYLNRVGEDSFNTYSIR